MANDLLDQLKAIDPAVLTEVVRKDQRDPGLEIQNWTVEPLSHEKIIGTTGGLFRFYGTAGNRSWSVILKCLNNPKEWGQQQPEWTYWRREIEAFQSGMVEKVPAGIRAPRSYGVMETEQGARMWIEHIEETTGKEWTLENFRKAALQMGRSQGAYLTGTPIPEYPWLCPSFFRSFWAEKDWWTPFMNPESAENAWKSPIVQRAFNEQTKSRVLVLLAEKERFFEVNDRLPQVLCHNDAHRRNLMWSRKADMENEELVAIDWAFWGPGAVGNDLCELVGTSLYFFDYDPYDAAALEAAVFEAYLTGLAEAGTAIDFRLVRLGYLIGLLFSIGATLPGWVAFAMAPESTVDTIAMYGQSHEALLAGWIHLDAFILDHEDEARSLIQELGL